MVGLVSVFGVGLPEWGPVPGVWFPEDEWLEILWHVRALVLASNVAWVYFPHKLRRTISDARGREVVPVLMSRLRLVQELLLRDWDLFATACQLTPGVRQFSFRGDVTLHPTAYQLVPGAFMKAICPRIQARNEHKPVRFPLPPRRALSPADQQRSCRSRTAQPSDHASAASAAASAPSPGPGIRAPGGPPLPPPSALSPGPDGFGSVALRLVSCRRCRFCRCRRFC